MMTSLYQALGVVDAIEWAYVLSLYWACVLSFLAKHQLTQMTQPSYTQIWCSRLLGFSKTKITSEREEISDCQWDSGKYSRAADSDWENYVRSHFEEDWGIIVLCTMFHVSYIFFNKCLFHITWLDTFWTDLIYNGILFSHKKRWNATICNNMDGPWEYHAEWSKSDRKGQESYDYIHMSDINQKVTNKQIQQTNARTKVLINTI